MALRTLETDEIFRETPLPWPPGAQARRLPQMRALCAHVPPPAQLSRRRCERRPCPPRAEADHESTSPPPTPLVIVWDVDNARPPRDAPPVDVLAEIDRVLMLACGGEKGDNAPPPTTTTTFHAFANEQTLAARPDLAAALAQLAVNGSTLETTPTSLRNSADALCSSAVVAATAAGARGLALVSGDAGLATALAHAGSTGVTTVAVGDFGKTDARQARHALVRAAGGRAVPWRDVVQRVREKRQQRVVCVE